MGTAPPAPLLDPRRRALRARIARAHGHLHGIMDMIDSGRSDPEILQQMRAVRAALTKATRIIVEDLLDELEKATPSQRNQKVATVREAITTLA